MSLYHWQSFCEETLKIKNLNFIRAWWEETLEPHMKVTDKRPYHNLLHVADLLAWADRIGVRDRASVGLSIYFHDVIYEPLVGRNEERSAEMFEKFAKQASQYCKDEEWCRAERIRDAANWIIETKNHTTTKYVSPFSQEDFLLFLDFDMSILGSDRERYRQYAQNVRQEYSHIPDAQFRNGRTQFLMSLSRAPDADIFKTERMRDLLLKNARDNIAWEIEQLANAKF